jgi:hypothetical protein
MVFSILLLIVHTQLSICKSCQNMCHFHYTLDYLPRNDLSASVAITEIARTNPVRPNRMQPHRHLKKKQPIVDYDSNNNFLNDDYEDQDEERSTLLQAFENDMTTLPYVPSPDSAMSVISIHGSDTIDGVSMAHHQPLYFHPRGALGELNGNDTIDGVPSAHHQPLYVHPRGAPSEFHGNDTIDRVSCTQQPLCIQSRGVPSEFCGNDMTAPSEFCGNGMMDRVSCTQQPSCVPTRGAPSEFYDNYMMAPSEFCGNNMMDRVSCTQQPLYVPT